MGKLFLITIFFFSLFFFLVLVLVLALVLYFCLDAGCWMLGAAMGIEVQVSRGRGGSSAAIPRQVSKGRKVFGNGPGGF